MKTYASVYLTVLAVVALPVAALAQATFMGIGSFSGDATSGAYGVSGDGDYVIGESLDGSANPRAVVWDVRSGGLTDIGTPLYWSSIRGRGIDVDNNGYYHATGYGTNNYGLTQAFYYSSETDTFTPIPFLTGGGANYGQFLRVKLQTGNEAYIVGWSDRSPGLDEHAFRWRTGAPGASLDLGYVPTYDGRSFAYSIGWRPSGGSVIRGWGDTGYVGGNNPGAFSWNSGDSTNYFLGFLDDPWLSTSQSFAYATSRNGDWIVGNGTNNSFCSTNREAYIVYADYDDVTWDLGTVANPECPGSQMLGSVPGHEGHSCALAVSNDGEVVVGWARHLVDTTPEDLEDYVCAWAEPENEQVAFIWDSDNGMQVLQTVLETEYSLDLTGWHLLMAEAISDDATVICGKGLYNGVEQGWVATIGSLGSVGACCMPSDLSCSEIMETTCVNQGGVFMGSGTTCAEVVCCPDPFADADLDGDVDQADFGAWQVCYTNVSGTVSVGCECYDRDGNNRVDAIDFAAFQACWSGAGVSASPDCD